MHWTFGPGLWAFEGHFLLKTLQRDRIYYQHGNITSLSWHYQRAIKYCESTICRYGQKLFMFFLHFMFIWTIKFTFNPVWPFEARIKAIKSVWRILEVSNKRGYWTYVGILIQRQMEFRIFTIFHVLFVWLFLEVSGRDAKSCRCCRYICAIFFSWCLFLGHFGSFLGYFG